MRSAGSEPDYGRRHLELQPLAALAIKALGLPPFLFYTSWEPHGFARYMKADKFPLPQTVAASTRTIRFRAVGNSLGERVRERGPEVG